MIIIAWAALRAAVIQIMLALLTSSFMKELIIVGIKKLAKKTDNELDDKIASLIDDAVHGRLESEDSNDAKICPKCQALLDQ